MAADAKPHVVHGGESALARLLRAREIGILVMLVLFAATVGTIEPRFLTWETFRIVLLAMPLLLTVAIGQMFVIVARHVDISVGSTLGLVAILTGMLFRDVPDLPLVAGFAFALAAGALLGLCNGLVVTLFSLPSIIVTLGTLSLYRGLTFIVSGGRQVDPNDVPEALIRLSQSREGIPPVVWLSFLVAAIAYVVLRHLRLGREIYAIGSNPLAAQLRGLRVARLTLFVFAVSGALAGLAGVMYASRFGYVNPGITGVGFELSVIAAVVIGGCSITGGTGSVPGTVLGVLLLAMISAALPILGISGFWQEAIFGAIIVTALVVDRIVFARTTGGKT